MVQTTLKKSMGYKWKGLQLIKLLHLITSIISNENKQKIRKEKKKKKSTSKLQYKQRDSPVAHAPTRIKGKRREASKKHTPKRGLCKLQWKKSSLKWLTGSMLSNTYVLYKDIPEINLRCFNREKRIHWIHMFQWEENPAWSGWLVRCYQIYFFSMIMLSNIQAKRQPWNQSIGCNIAEMFWSFSFLLFFFEIFKIVLVSAIHNIIRSIKTDMPL